MQPIERSRTIKPFDNQRNFTTFHNVLLDVLMPELPPNVWKLITFVVRRTIGWRKDEEFLSYGMIRRGTGIRSDTTVRKSLKHALDQSLIVCVAPSSDDTHANDWTAYRYRINLDYQITTFFNYESGAWSRLPENMLNDDGAIQPFGLTPENEVIPTPNNGARLTPKNGVMLTPKNEDNRKKVIKNEVTTTTGAVAPEGGASSDTEALALLQKLQTFGIFSNNRTKKMAQRLISTKTPIERLLHIAQTEHDAISKNAKVNDAGAVLLLRLEKLDPAKWKPRKTQNATWKFEQVTYTDEQRKDALDRIKQQRQQKETEPYLRARLELLRTKPTTDNIREEIRDIQIKISRLQQEALANK